jgi:hypothetical protein
MGKFLCLIGRHRWERQTNPEGGKYYSCSRCGKDQYRGGSGMGATGGEFTAGG